MNRCKYCNAEALKRSHCCVDHLHLWIKEVGIRAVRAVEDFSAACEESEVDDEEAD